MDVVEDEEVEYLVEEIVYMDDNQKNVEMDTVSEEHYPTPSTSMMRWRDQVSMIRH